MLKFVLTVFGVALILSGGLWALQGAGVVQWPASSFMLAQREWVFYGAATFVIGFVLLWISSRFQK